MDCCLPDSVQGVSQVRILEWVAISFSRGGVYIKRKRWKGIGVPDCYLLGSLTG